MSTQKYSDNASKFAAKYQKLSGTGVSRQQITFSYQDGISKEKENKKTGKIETNFSVRKATRDEKGIVPAKKLSINWQQSENGQELILIQDGSIVATFATLVTGEIVFNPYPVWDEPNNYIAIPTLTTFNPIESLSTGNFFTQWVTSPEFFEHISILSERGTYTPQLVKMCLLLLPYLAARDQVVTENMAVDVYTHSLVIDKDWLIADYLDNISLLTNEDQTAKMKKLFRNAQSVLTLAPASENPPQLMTALESNEKTADTQTVEVVELEKVDQETQETEPPKMIEVMSDSSEVVDITATISKPSKK